MGCDHDWTRDEAMTDDKYRMIMNIFEAVAKESRAGALEEAAKVAGAYLGMHTPSPTRLLGKEVYDMIRALKA